MRSTPYPHHPPARAGDAGGHPDARGVFVPRWVLEATGELRDAYVLAQILYWWQPPLRGGAAHRGETARKRGQEGEWLVTTDAELADALLLSVDQVRRARRALVDGGWVEACSSMVDGVKCSLVRPVEAAPEAPDEAPDPAAAPRSETASAPPRSGGCAASSLYESEIQIEPPLVPPSGVDAAPEGPRRDVLDVLASAALPALPFPVPDVVAHGGALPAALDLCAHMAAQLRARGAGPQVPPEGRSKSWVLAMEQMIRLDGIPPDRIRACLDWLDAGRDRTSSFWRANIWSPGKLRERYPRLREGWADEHGRALTGGVPRHMERTPGIAHVDAADLAEAFARSAAARDGAGARVDAPPDVIDVSFAPSSTSSTDCPQEPTP